MHTCGVQYRYPRPLHGVEEVDSASNTNFPIAPHADKNC